MKITKDKWIWMPHPAHFICSMDCRFVLATKVGKYIVSTVGELWQDRQVREIHAGVYDPKWLEENKHLKGDYFDNAYYKKFGYEDLHLTGWKYETMVFKAVKRKPQNKEDTCCPFKIESGSNVDEKWYKTAEEALKGHYKLCNKWSNSLTK